MSRSYKKQPITKDNGRSKKESKQMANRAIRRKLKDPEFEMGNNNEYQKHYESWEIADYVSRWTLDDALSMYRNPNSWSYFATHQFREKCPTEEKFIAWWRKETLGK